MTSCAVAATPAPAPAPAEVTLQAATMVKPWTFYNWALVHPDDFATVAQDNFATLSRGIRIVQVRVGKRSSDRPIVVLMPALKDVTLRRGSVHLNRYRMYA